MRDSAMAAAASTVLTFDHFAERCARGKPIAGKDSTIVATWVSTQGVELVRTRLQELAGDASQQPLIAQARAAIVQRYGTMNFLSCRAMVQVTRQPDAQFASTSPQLLRALRAPAMVAASSTPVGAPDTAVSATNTSSTSNASSSASLQASADASSSTHAALLARIEGFAFDTRPKMGMGGFIALDIYPIVLFHNGEVLTDVEGLSFRAGLDAHKRAEPTLWTRWRRTGRSLEIVKDGRWDTLEFPTIYSSVPAGFRLQGLFRSTSGVGNVAVGGTQSVTAWNEFRFSNDGRVQRGGGAGSRAEAGGTSVVTSAVAANRRGTYRIDGLELVISYDDGSSDRRIFITDPAKPTVIWLDGVSYVLRK